jgi:hypothetical protein
MGLAELMPESFRDHDYNLWVPSKARARWLLGELIEHELAALRAREAWLRTHIEAPARRAAQEQARVLTGRELDLLRNEQLHDQLFHRAYQALLRSRTGTGRRSAPPRPRAAAVRPEPAVLRALPGDAPKTHRQTHTVFFDFPAARRAAYEDILAEAAAEAEAAATATAETPALASQ